MNQKLRKITALALALVMMMSATPLSVLAEIVTDTSGGISLMLIADLVHTKKYEFRSEGNLVDTQIVKNGESLIQPATPAAPAGKKFTGWKVGGDTVSFGTPITVTGTETVTANAVFEDVVYVYFVYDSTNDSVNNGDVIKTKEVIPGNTTDASGIPLVVNIPGKAFSHWSNSAGGSAFNFSSVINADTTLYAVLHDRWTVTFDAQDGSFTLPKYIINGQQLGAVTDPTRPGYTFAGWYTTPQNAGVRITSGLVITSSITLYARWTAERVNYTIVYWLENADDTGYTYHETVTVTAGNDRPFTGSAIVIPQGRKQNNRYNYFSYKENDAGVIAQGDGTSVVNVYYSRNSYTVIFDLNRDNATMTIGGTTYTDGGTKYTFTAKYNSDISALWPTASNIPNVIQPGHWTRPGNSWVWVPEKTFYFYGWPGNDTTYVSKRMNFTSDLFSTNGDREYDGLWLEEVNKYDLHYMIESLDGTGSLYNDVLYKEDMSYNQFAYSQGNWGAKPIAGATNVGKSTDSDDGQDDDYDVYFYYTRDSYDLSFFNYNATVTDSTETLKYGTDISGKNFTPTKPAVLPEGSTFAGWFTTKGTATGSEFAWTNAKMPSNNLELYAKWLPPVHQVKYYTTEAHSAFSTIDGIPHNTSISLADLPQGGIYAGPSWLGWYWHVGDVFAPYSFSNKIIDDSIVIYPVWTTNSYGVIYHANGGSGAAPVDIYRYKAGALAGVKTATGMTAPAGKVFVGWNTLADGTGISYYPNDKLPITGNMTLFAKWGPVPGKTSLTYHSNFSGGAADIVEGNLLNNSTLTVKPDTTFVRIGYNFAGWNTKADGTGASFAPGAQIVVSTPGTNDLYARWERNVTTVTATKKDRKSVV